MALNSRQLYEIRGGGFSFSTSTFNAISRFMTTLIKLGQLAGSGIRRAITKSYC